MTAAPQAVRAALVEGPPDQLGDLRAVGVRMARAFQVAPRARKGLPGLSQDPRRDVMVGVSRVEHKQPKDVEPDVPHVSRN